MIENTVKFTCDFEGCGNGYSFTSPVSLKAIFMPWPVTLADDWNSISEGGFTRIYCPSHKVEAR